MGDRLHRCRSCRPGIFRMRHFKLSSVVAWAIRWESKKPFHGETVFYSKASIISCQENITVNNIAVKKLLNLSKIIRNYGLKFVVNYA